MTTTNARRTGHTFSLLCVISLVCTAADAGKHDPETGELIDASQRLSPPPTAESLRRPGSPPASLTAGCMFATRGAELYTIDKVTAAATLVGAHGIGSIGGLEFDLAGTLYGLRYGNPSELYRIDPTTGLATLIGNTGVGFVFEGGIVFAPNGLMYGTNEGSSAGARTFRIDPTTGIGTPFGVPQARDLNGFATDGTSVYALDRLSNAFGRLDVTTGQFIPTGNLGVTVGDVGGLAYDPTDGKFYATLGGTGGFYSIDPTTGLATFIGTHGTFRGLAVVRCDSVLPIANAGNDVAVCAGASVDLDGSTSTHPSCPGGLEYRWLESGVPLGPWSSSSLLNVTPAASATYLLEVRCSTAPACSATDSMVVTVVAPPTAVAGIDVTACVGDTVILDGSGTVDPGCPGGISYEWRDGATVVATTTQWSPSTTSASTITYTLVASCIGLGGCESSDTVTMIVAPPPVAAAGQNVAACVGDAVTLDAAGTTDVGCPNGVSFEWRDGATVVASSAQWSPATASAGATTYTLVASCVGVVGCDSTDTVTVTVVSPPIAAAGADLAACVDTVVTLDGSATVDRGCPSGLLYEWRDGATVVANTPQWSPPTTASGITVYTLVTTCNGLPSCVSSDSVTVVVAPPPTAAAGVDVAVCIGSVVVLDGSTSLDRGCPSGVAYLWRDGAIVVANTPQWSPPTTTSGTTTYTLVTSCIGLSGCSATDDVSVTVVQPPIARAGTDVTSCRGGAITLDGSTSVDLGCIGGYILEWRDGANTVATGPIFMPPTATVGLTTYTLVARCLGLPQCESTDNVQVAVQVCLAVSWDVYTARWINTDPARVDVRWRTLLEEGTVAFIVERAPGQNLVFAAVGLPVAATGPGVDYVFSDPGVGPFERPWYRIVEYTVGGRGDVTPAFQADSHGARPRR